MWKIGNIEIKGKIVLAPMAGYTFKSYREYMKSFGCDVVYSEMVSDMGLIYGNEETISYLESSETEQPLGIQLFGSSIENITKAAKIAANHGQKFAFFDINSGCPVPKVTKTGAGSSLLKNPDLLAETVASIKKETGLPVTVKIRLGWDSNHINYLEVIQKLEAAGVDAIAIHARTTKELYYGQPHFDMLKDLRLKMNVPLIVSGNIFTLDDAINALEITKADAVMIARGGLGNPHLIKQIKHFYETGERLNNASLEEQKRYCLELGEVIAKEKGEMMGMRMYRSIAPKFFTGFPNSKEIRTKLAQNLDSLEYLKKAIDEFIA